jgi:integrase
MPLLKITARNLEALKAVETPTLYWDTEIRRFGIRVQPSGKISFVFQHEHLGQSKRVTIGEYGRPWSIDDARTEVHRLIAQTSPDYTPALKSSNLKLSEIADQWFETKVKPHREPATIRDYEAKLRLYILPRFKDAVATRISRKDVIEWHAKMRSKPRVANYALTVLSGVFNFAADTGLIPVDHPNPARRIQKFKERSIERFLSTEEMTRLGTAIRDLEAEGRISMFAAAAFRLLMLTGARRGEIKDLKWEWVDLDRRVLFLPTSKTGKKTIRLSPDAVTVLQALPRVKGNPYVIVGQRPGECMQSLWQPWLAICERAEIVNCRIHDLRHSYASVAAMSGLSLPDIGKLLGHTVPATTQRYAHLADTHAQASADLIGNTLGRLLAPSAPVPPAIEPDPVTPEPQSEPATEGDNVLPFRRTA